MWNFGRRCQHSSFLPVIGPRDAEWGQFTSSAEFWRPALPLSEGMRERKKKCDVGVFALLTWSPSLTIKCMTSSGFSPSSPFFSLTLLSFPSFFHSPSHLLLCNSVAAARARLWTFAPCAGNISPFPPLATAAMFHRRSLLTQQSLRYTFGMFTQRNQKA